MQAEEGRGRPLALVGDFNVAHTETDLANPRANRCNAGFLPEERAWVDRLLASGFVNAFGQFEPAGGHYTWYSMRPTVRERKVGWRLDYAFVDPTLQGSLAACRHLTERTGSDHRPPRRVQDFVKGGGALNGVTHLLYRSPNRHCGRL